MSRVRINLNREWKFLRADVAGAERIDFDDSSWQQIGLPHTFDLPYFRTPEFYVGSGWYRKAFPVPSPGTPGKGQGEGLALAAHNHALTPALSRSTGGGRRVFLEFDGVFQVAEVFVNGRAVGQHEGGYTGFSLDITNSIRSGQNLLAVRVNNNWSPRLQPRAGEHIFSGGIYRDVYLVITDELHVTWHGTFVTTPHVSHESATVNVKTEIRNASPQEARCTLLTTVIDADGQVVSEMQSVHSLEPGAMVEFDQTSGPIERPNLWHPDHPYRYRVRTQVYDQDTLVRVDRRPGVLPQRRASLPARRQCPSGP
jgi:beta-galactosidase